MPKSLWIFPTLLLFAALGVPVANADPIVIPFSGSGTSGSLAPGEAWAINADGGFDWGAPGVTLGLLAWNGNVAVNDFTITFNGLPAGVQISNSFGVNCVGGTLFCSFLGSPSSWTPVISNGGATVTFTAPAGVTLAPGTGIFDVQIFFTGNEGPTVDFTGGWSAAAVPEPATVALIPAGIGFLLLMRKRLAQAHQQAT